jgi:hypothetical protein
MKKEPVVITPDNIAVYVPITLRTDCVEIFVESFRAFYPSIPLYLIDNCGKHMNLQEQFPNINAYWWKLANPEPVPLTQLQWVIGLDLFNYYEALMFSADDVIFKQHGFIEKATNVLNAGNKIVSLTTDIDPVSYIYTFEFDRDVGFNQELKGKDRTDHALVKSVKKTYGKFPQIGKYWRRQATPPWAHGDSWGSKWLLHYNAEDNVNVLLRNMGIDPGDMKSDKPNRRLA